jgi:hypothetical protein
VLMEDSGAIKVKKMAFLDMLEMVADWEGAGLAYGNPDTLGWYLKTEPNRMLHPDTKAWIEAYLGVEKPKGKPKNDDGDAIKSDERFTKK